MLKVYLAGGMKGSWQKEVVDTIGVMNPRFEFLDPRDNATDIPDQYTAWDMLALRRCDVVFGYMEHDNPSGIGLAFEFGVARALGLTTILVIDPKHPMFRRFGIVRAGAEVVFDNLMDAAAFLNKMR
jgi:hypothetical protein